MAVQHPTSPSARIYEGQVLKGETGRSYLLVSALGQSNVWTAVDAETQQEIYIIKQPSDFDNARQGWPSFQHEMIMHELFKDSPSIRAQLDRIPPQNVNEPPRVVLEILESTLWSARSQRSFTYEEIKRVMRMTMASLKDVHAKGLVFADLKMENVLISNFDPKIAPKVPTIIAKLGDLGLVMPPSRGSVQPIAYRAPEVYFRFEITPKADIWGWGLICCHLLEAQHSFGKTGMYDNNYRGSANERQQRVMSQMTNDYDLQHVEYYEGCDLPQNKAEHHEGSHWDMLANKGLPAEDIDFLKWVLNPDPTQRPDADAILQSKWLRASDSDADSIFSPAEGAALSRSGSVLSNRRSIISPISPITDKFQDVFRPETPEGRKSSVAEQARDTVRQLAEAMDEFLGRTRSRRSEPELDTPEGKEAQDKHLSDASEARPEPMRRSSEFVPVDQQGEKVSTEAMPARNDPSLLAPQDAAATLPAATGGAIEKPAVESSSVESERTRLPPTQSAPTQSAPPQATPTQSIESRSAPAQSTFTRSPPPHTMSTQSASIPSSSSDQTMEREPAPVSSSDEPYYLRYSGAVPDKAVADHVTIAHPANTTLSSMEPTQHEGLAHRPNLPSRNTGTYLSYQGAPVGEAQAAPLNFGGGAPATEVAGSDTSAGPAAALEGQGEMKMLEPENSIFATSKRSHISDPLDPLAPADPAAQLKGSREAKTGRIH